MKTPTAKKTFHMQVLPDICIAFASEKGKQLFQTALATEHMNCYFPLASQFRTQELFYCGLSSLVMVLNSLAVDPVLTWKGNFYSYHEDMLDCSSSLEEIRKIGIPMDKLMHLALCNQLDGELKRVSDTMDILEFREDVKNATKSTKKAIIVSYGRGALGQAGTGHFSPIGGYNLQEDMVLVMDVARFKYPPYWISLTKLWEAMRTKDVETGLYRGYMVLWRAYEGPANHH
uniref:glutathione gamma-glutamylcysteinyltransferase-like n=1 Tax=Styela clava TaxID=7725 RepID=UPI00193A7BAD|nr:glutathione gamma-glutamylcysteinyltransferase-like [Styela clava]